MWDDQGDEITDALDRLHASREDGGPVHVVIGLRLSASTLFSSFPENEIGLRMGTPRVHLLTWRMTSDNSVLPLPVTLTRFRGV